MSVSDPLIKDIKGSVLKFLQDSERSGPITDKNLHLLPFCQNIEKVFSFGVVPSQQTVLGFATKSSACDDEAWNCLEKIGRVKDDAITFGYTSAVDNVRKYKNVLGNGAKLRLLIRCCLTQKSLHVPVKYMVEHKLHAAFYKEGSILGDEILLEIFLSALLQCAKINFRLDLGNVAFLDLSWSLPDVLKLEVVPCRSLGLSVSFAGNKAVIVDIKSDSVLQEYHNVEVGDVLNNLNKLHICLATKGKLGSIAKLNKGKPITLTIVKAKYIGTNKLYEPIVDLLKQVHIDPDILKTSECPLTELQSVARSNSAGFLVTYVGSVSAGKCGDVRQIDKSVRLLLSRSAHTNPNCKRIKLVVRFEIGEIGVTVLRNESSELGFTFSFCCRMAQVMLKHSYMEISACGSVSQMPYYFAYIAGNEYCNKATDFTCYVFHIKNYDLTYTILQSIGQGFQRTHFAV